MIRDTEDHLETTFSACWLCAVHGDSNFASVSIFPLSLLCRTKQQKLLLHLLSALFRFSKGKCLSVLFTGACL